MEVSIRAGYQFAAAKLTATRFKSSVGIVDYPRLPRVQVVAAVIENDSSVLLGLRAPHRRSCPNCWDLIGGHIEGNETALDALKRELSEEIGVSPVRPSFLCALHLKDEIEGATLLHVFLVKRWRRTPTVLNDEHAELRWFPFAEAASLSNLAASEYRSLFAGLE